MLFKRPKDLNIPDMCKIVDKLIQQDEWTKQEIDDMGKYLYIIIYSISKHKNYFYDSDDCDNFSIYLAEQLYYRFTNRTKGLEKIKSCRNYIDKVLKGRILNWQQTDKFRELLEDNKSTIKYNLGRYIDVTSYKEQIRDEIDASDRDKLSKLVMESINDLPNIVKNVSNHTQFKLDKYITNNLYISCLLSLINSVTLNVKLEEQIKDKSENGTLRSDYVIRNRIKNLDGSIILWHLDDNFIDIVKVLINRIKVMFVESVESAIKEVEVTPDILDAMISINGGEYRGKISE